MYSSVFPPGSCVIYALTDPRDGRARYIGKTKLPPLERLDRHISESRKRHCAHFPKSLWIKRLAAEGLKPGIKPLVVVPSTCWEQYEIAVIALYRAIEGKSLLNATPGGDGREIRHSPEARAKMSVAARGKKKPPMSAEHKAKLAAAIRLRPEMMQGRKPSGETRAKMSAAQKRRDPATFVGRPISAAQKAQNSAFHKANPTATQFKPGHEMPEAVRAKIRAARLGKPRPPEVKRKIAASLRKRAAPGQQELL